MGRNLWVLIFILSNALSAQAAQPLWDFESQVNLATWRIRSTGQDKLQRSDTYATSGEMSLQFISPAWQEGMEEWPAFDAKPTVSDWREFDRLVMDIINTNPERHFFSLLISDSRVPFREGLKFRFDLPAKGYKRFIVPLSSFPAAVDRADISMVHFYSERPKTDLSLHLDNVTLLKAGETVPEPPAPFVQDIAQLVYGGSASFKGIMERCEKGLARALNNEDTKLLAEEELARIAARIQEICEHLEGSQLTLTLLQELQEELDTLPERAERKASELQFRTEFEENVSAKSEMIVGFATSMEKVLPKDMPFHLAVGAGVGVSLARNEEESFQVAVLPKSFALQDVEVSVYDVRNRRGQVFSSENIDCDVMGYVETKTRPPYMVNYIGWWPDPILDFIGPVDIAKGDLQTFWIRVKAPKKQPPGIYEGILRVKSSNGGAMDFTLSIRVYDFTLPDHSALPTAITFFERQGQMGGEDKWNEMKLQYADFLADYQIDYDSLYRGGSPDYEIVKHLHDQGRLVAFNLGNVFNGGTREEGFDQAIAQTVARIRPAYKQAKSMGLLDHAYIYGFDERPKEQFPLLERSAQALKKAFPEVLLMTTSYDHSYGLDTCVKSIDAWCPLTPKFEPKKVDEARAKGKKVWWYICCGPHNPYANWFVEYAAIESRLLMGPMTIKQRPDGFLYYSLSIWNQNKPITEGPFTNWDPVSWTVYHGDGSMLCSGPGGKPVPTIRLENYRDGQEDFAYACILEEIIGQYESREKLRRREKKWLQDAKKAMEVPEALVNTMSQYSRDPQDLYDYRNRIGELIHASGVNDANPWGENFGARGFSQ